MNPDHSSNEQQPASKLVGVLREAIDLIQMILFKELRDDFAQRFHNRNSIFRTMLVGSTLNTLFGQQNSEERFQNFLKENKGIIEQELLSLKERHPTLCLYLSDALRMQVLCDSLADIDSNHILIQANTYGYLIKDREIPLPSIFITSVRALGEKYGLTRSPQKNCREENIQ